MKFIRDGRRRPVGKRKCISLASGYQRCFKIDFPLQYITRLFCFRRFGDAMHPVFFVVVFFQLDYVEYKFGIVGAPNGRRE